MNAQIICVGGPGTYACEIAESEVAVIAKFVRQLPLDQQTGLTPTQFEIVDVLQGGKAAHAGDPLILNPVLNDTPEPLVFLTKAKAAAKWSTPYVISPRTREYLQQVVKLPAEPAERLKFFWQRLEDQEEAIQHDAFDEFASVSYAGLQTLKPLFNHDQLVCWIQDSDQPASRRRLYLQMLSVCGSEGDVPLLEGILKSTNRRDRAALDGLIFCYLALRGEAGLPLIEERFLVPEPADYADLYSAIMALRWHFHESTVLKRERIATAMKHVLKRPEIADLVILHFAELKDWTVAPELFAMFKAVDAKNNWVRIPIIHYLQHCPLETAKTMLQKCEALDPEAARRAKAFPPNLPMAPTKTFYLRRVTWRC